MVGRRSSGPSGLSKFVGAGEPEELKPTEVLGSIQAVAGGTVILSDTIVGGAVQLLDNRAAVLITDSFSEGAVDVAKNKGNVTVTDSFLGEGVEISETEGNVNFSGNTSDESDLTIGKTKGDVTVEGNPSLGENFELSETTGHVRVLDNTINDNAEIVINFGGAVVSGNTVGDGLSLFKVTGGVKPATVIVVGNTVGDNVSLFEAGGPGGEVVFTANVVRGTASIGKTLGRVTATGNWLGYAPSASPVPGAEPEPVTVPELPYGGSLLVSQASHGADVRDNTITTNLGVTENLIGTNVSNNTVGVGITVSKNKGGTRVSLNRAGGSIECKDNSPQATGGGNVAGTSGTGGTLKGECATLGG